MNTSIFIILNTIIFACSQAKPTTTQTTTEEPLDLDLFLGAMGDGHFANIDMDGVEADAGTEEHLPMKKKTEKLPGMKKAKLAQEEADIGVAPTLSTLNSGEISTDDHFFGDASSVSNPASTYLEGGDFENMTQPKCQMLGCTGPIPNDGSYAMLSASIDGKACNQMFVPMNGCTDNKGYPMGMLCSICCDCANSFTAEMKKTFGYKQGIESSSFAK